MCGGDPWISVKPPVTRPDEEGVLEELVPVERHSEVRPVATR